MISKYKKILTFFAHPDDETLAAGATINKLSNSGSQVYVAIPATGIHARKNTQKKTDREKKLLSLRNNTFKALSIIGVKKSNIFFGDFDDNELDKHTLLKLIHWIENIIDKSNTVLWNGPAGFFENKNFAYGTNCIAKKISKNTVDKSLISVLGGGDTISAINKIEEKLTFTHLSTAGGAFLEYLEGKDLPGLSVLK